MSGKAIVEYRKTLTDIGTFDGVVNFKNNLQLPPNKTLEIAVIKAQLSKQLPNIYDFDSHDNTRLETTKDGWTTTDVVVLPDGIYTLEYLENAINDALGIAGYWTNPADPGVKLTYNLATTKVNTYLDSTKLAAVHLGGPLGLDWTPQSTIYATLGYLVTAGRFTGTGTYSATEYPQLDEQGTVADISSSFNLVYRYINSDATEVIASIPLTSGTADEDEFLYPLPGQVPVYMQINNTGSMTGISMSILNGRGNPLVGMYGNFFIEIELRTM